MFVLGAVFVIGVFVSGRFAQGLTVRVVVVLVRLVVFTVIEAVRKVCWLRVGGAARCTVALRKLGCSVWFLGYSRSVDQDCPAGGVN